MESNEGPRIVVEGGISDSVKMKPEEESARLEREKKLAARSVKRAIRETIKQNVEAAVEAREALLKQPPIVEKRVEKIEEVISEQLPVQQSDPSKNSAPAEVPIIESPLPSRPRISFALPPPLPPIIGNPTQIPLSSIKFPPGLQVVSDQEIFKMCAICAVAGAIVGVGGYRLMVRLIDVFTPEVKPVRQIIEVLDSVEDLANAE